MKIGILSLSMGRNYGGILQQFALSQFLQSLGHKVIIVNRQPNNGGFVMRSIRKAMGHFGVRRYRQRSCPKTKIRSFITDYFNMSEPVFSSYGLRQLCKREGINILVFGSDQIWRREFEMKYGLDYFGVSTSKNIKKVAYAPSFGMDKWEYSTRETVRIKQSLSTFAALSAREEAGVKLIKDNLQLDAALVSDPTMLLDGDFYAKIASPQIHIKPYCFVYWLGEKEVINKVIEKYKAKNDMKIVVIRLRDQVDLPSIEEWLSLIKNASYVITDSFHGIVFSVLFGRQFEVHCNKSGGYGRIQTLMHQLNLDEKLITPNAPVDYTTLYSSLHTFQEFSKAYLKNSIQ